MIPAQAFARTPADIAAMKADAWAGFVSDYVLGIDTDPGEARARYNRKMEAIAALESAQGDA